MVLIGFNTFAFPRIEEITIDSPMLSIYYGTTQQDIFSRYKEIKRNNEALKATKYSELCEQYSTIEHRILSSLVNKKQ